MNSRGDSKETLVLFWNRSRFSFAFKTLFAFVLVFCSPGIDSCFVCVATAQSTPPNVITPQPVTFKLPPGFELSEEDQNHSSPAIIPPRLRPTLVPGQVPGQRSEPFRPTQNSSANDFNAANAANPGQFRPNQLPPQQNTLAPTPAALNDQATGFQRQPAMTQQSQFDHGFGSELSGRAPLPVSAPEPVTFVPPKGFEGLAASAPANSAFVKLPSAVTFQPPPLDQIDRQINASNSKVRSTMQFKTIPKPGNFLKKAVSKVKGKIGGKNDNPFRGFPTSQASPSDSRPTQSAYPNQSGPIANNVAKQQQTQAEYEASWNNSPSTRIASHSNTNSGTAIQAGQQPQPTTRQTSYQDVGGNYPSNGNTWQSQSDRHPLAIAGQKISTQSTSNFTGSQSGNQTSQSGSIRSTTPQTFNALPQAPMETVDYNGNLDLVQPPIAGNQVNYSHPTTERHSREQFWNQFSTLPPDDKKARTEGYDSLQATLNNGFWFGGIDVLYLEPMFQGNNAFSISGAGRGSASAVDFGFDLSYRGYFGFETNAGPAVKFSFWRMNEFSSLNSFVSDGTQSATTFIDLDSSSNQIFLTTGLNVGSRLTHRQQVKMNSAEIMVYKDQKNPVSRVRGNIGLRHVSLQQKLFAGLDDPVLGSTAVRNFNDYFSVGPKLGIEYFRPIGHTDLEMQAGFFGSLLFGRRDVTLSQTGSTAFQFEQIGKVEAMSIFDLYLGVQWNIEVSKCQHVFFRTALESQLWAGSDTALDVETDLGLYGMTFGFGVQR